MTLALKKKKVVINLSSYIICGSIFIFRFSLYKKIIQSLCVFIFYCCSNKLPETQQIYYLTLLQVRNPGGLGCSSAPGLTGQSHGVSQPGLWRANLLLRSFDCDRIHLLAVVGQQSHSLLVVTWQPFPAALSFLLPYLCLCLQTCKSTLSLLPLQIYLPSPSATSLLPPSR